MKLKSTPKPVNFRIVLNNVEITSIELLQQHFDFERHFVTDQTQFISWLKKINKDRGDRVESCFNNQADEISYVTDIISILNIIYEPKPAFNNPVNFVNFLYDNNDNNRYEVVKSNFKNYISKNRKLLHKWFPIDSIPKNNKNLYVFFDSLDVSPEMASYRSQLYYWHGNLEESLRIGPPLWKLNTKERAAIQAIASGSQLKTVNDVIASGNLSIIGVEFIFLSAIAYCSICQKNDNCETISELIDRSPSFKLLRDRIGGSIKKVIKKENPNFFNVFAQLGYTEPHQLDPLFNEKLLLSSFFANDGMRDVFLKEIKTKTDYFPAHYLLIEDGHNSKVLKNRDESLCLRWLSHILDYYDNPHGLEGDDLLCDEVREMAIIVRQFKEYQQFMNGFFHFPFDLDLKSGNSTLRKHIKNVKSTMGIEKLVFAEKCDQKSYKETVQQKKFGSWASNSLKLSKKEKEYLNFFKKVMDISAHWADYIEVTKGQGSFTPKATSLIKKYRENNQTLHKEKLFVVTILLLVRYHNNNRIFEKESEIKELKKTYVPLRALFKDEIPLLSSNDKKILQPSVRSECLKNNWNVINSQMRDNYYYRRNYYDKILRRWIANFIYYTE
ncbi:MAG: hypothetical protein IKW85_04890 [Muribaculaceae bacterium]|nr:hypothetical protein [Muribaculaceae bacterium]